MACFLLNSTAFLDAPTDARNNFASKRLFFLDFIPDAERSLDLLFVTMWSSQVKKDKTELGLQDSNYNRPKLSEMEHLPFLKGFSRGELCASVIERWRQKGVPHSAIDVSGF